MTLLSLIALLFGADPLPPDEAAAIAVEQRDKVAEVEKKYGGRKPFELSNDERAQYTRERAEAEQQVLDAHGVDAKQWALSQMKQSPAQAADQKAREKALVEAREKAAQAAKDEAEAERPIPIQQGISDTMPVTVEERKGDGVSIEEGLPAEAASDASEASDGQVQSGVAPAEAPARPARPAPKRRRR